MINQIIRSNPKLRKTIKALEEIGVYLASDAYQAAAKRLCRKNVLVIFANNGMRPETIGKAYNIGRRKKTLVIQIRCGLSGMLKVSTLVHECIHIQYGEVPTLSREKGKRKFISNSKPVYHGLIETDVLEEGAEIMEQVQARFEMLQQEKGYRWVNQMNIDPSVVNLRPRYEAELLSCVY